MLDHVLPGDLGTIARQLSYLDAQGGRPRGFAGAHSDRNAVLYLPLAGKPTGFRGLSARRQAGAGLLAVGGERGRRPVQRERQRLAVLGLHLQPARRRLDTLRTVPASHGRARGS